MYKFSPKKTLPIQHPHHHAQLRRLDLRKWMRSSNLVSNLYYGLHIDDLPVILCAKPYEKSVDDIIKKYLPNTIETERRRIKKDIKGCYLKYKVSPVEYFLFDFPLLPDSKRKEFLTDKFMYMTMGRIAGRKKHDSEIEDKWGFYHLAKPFFKRSVVLVKTKADFHSFEEMVLQVNKLICKPNDKALGSGIFVVDVKNEVEAEQLFEKLLSKGGSWIVEERIQQSPIMAQWNESSVNSIRVYSFLSSKGFHLLTPVLRTGREGACIDNGAAGGVFANIDYTTGIVISDGFNEKENKYYPCHPDSNIQFKGWTIPCWEGLLQTVEKIHKEVMPAHPYIGWDFALTDNNEWVVIEANWGQLLCQYVDKKGRKAEFLEYMNIK